MKNAKLNRKLLAFPAFNESILTPGENEILRAVQVIPLNEFRFRDYCDRMGVVNYLPLRKAWKIHHIVRKGKTYTYSVEVLRPLLPSYLFIKTSAENLRSLYDSKVLVRFLPLTNQQRFSEELRALRIAETIGLHEDLEVHKEIPVGARFLIQSGVWEGVIGWLTQKDGLFKWTIDIDICGQLVTATIDPTQFKMTRIDD